MSDGEPTTPPTGRFGIVYVQTHPEPWEFFRAPIVREVSQIMPVLLVHPVAARTGYPRLVRGLGHGRPGSTRALEPGRFQVDVQLLLPFGRFSLIGRANQRLIAAQARRAMRAAGIDSGALWFHQPRWWPMVEMFDGQLLSLYDCTDLYSAFPDIDSRAAAAVTAQERHLMSTPGLAIAVSEELRQRLCQFGERPVGRIPHGFDPSAGDGPAAIPADVARPLIGLVGRLNDRYDYDVLDAIADRFTDCTLVLAGSIDEASSAAGRIAKLASRKNVTLTGGLTRAQAAKLATAVEVGVIPYVDTPMNRACDPVKMYDHLGGGVPVVASDVSGSIRDEPLVRTAGNREDFLTAIDAALQTPLDQEALHAWRQQNTNAARARQVAQLVRAHAA
ncbi:MAG: glycosyltransferase [Candidatus Dormiibacterota bacterium]